MKAKDQIQKRVYGMLGVLSLLPLLVAGQVLRLYVAEGPELRAQGERQANTGIDIPAMRGALLDRAGRTLAVNAPRYDVALDPTVVGFREQAGWFYEQLAALTRTSASALRQKVEGRSSPQYVGLYRNLSERQKEEVEGWDVPGLLLTPTFARRYNYGETAAHVLGHVSSDEQGLAGLEKQYDDFLRGEPGWRALKRDRRGLVKAFVGGTVIEPKHGQHLVLTLDLIRQTVLEEELARGVAEAGATWGTAIAMDPHTGAILAMANVPTYDPNRPSAFRTAARRNHAITDRIEPGSTFKLVTAAAAVESGLVRMGDPVETGDGWAVFRGRTMKDTHAHGTIPFTDVIALSSNVGTAKTAARMKPGLLYQYARNFGFGQPTWIDLPGEVGGLLKKTRRWSGTTLTTMSIGYEVDVTPLQMLTAYAAFANGGLLMRPYVVQERRDVTGNVLWRAEPDSIRRVIEPETAAELLPAFEKVVEAGTATEAQIEGLPIAGKTGTARKVKDGSYSAGAYRSSFVGFFPADDPKVAMIVVMDEPETSAYGGVVAAPVFQRTAQRWIGTFPDVARRVAPVEPLPPTSPDVPVQVAAAPSASIIEAGARLRQTDVAAGSDAADLASGETIQTDPPPATMPDLTGLSARQAVFWLRALGADVEVEGRGAVTEQAPEAGEPLPERALLTCR